MSSLKFVFLALISTSESLVPAINLEPNPPSPTSMSYSNPLSKAYCPLNAREREKNDTSDSISPWRLLFLSLFASLCFQRTWREKRVSQFGLLSNARMNHFVHLVY